MQASQLPAKIPEPFATSATGSLVNTINDTTTVSGGASWHLGWQAINDTPIASGGIPPSIGDFNGILKAVSAWAWWQAAGGMVFYDSAFSSANNGYPTGAIVRSSSEGVLWYNTIDNNTTNPESGNVGWRLINLAAASGQIFTASTTWTVPAGVSRVKLRMWGAGGGATYSNTGANTAGAGGGGGAYVEAWVAVTAGGSITVSVGTGGTGGTSSSQSGGNGGASAFSGLTAGGGVGAVAFTSSGAGGTSSGSPMLGMSGGPGGFGTAAGSSYFGGVGGTSFASAPFQTTSVGTAQNGFNGTFPAGGGNGGVFGGNGGQGAGGLVILEW